MTGGNFPDGQTAENTEISLDEWLWLLDVIDEKSDESEESES